MRTFLIGALSLLAWSSAASAAIEVWNPDWEKCELPRHCVTVEGPCGDWRAISRAHKKDAMEFNQSLKAHTQCTQMPEAEPAVTCDAGRCVTTPKDH